MRVEDTKGTSVATLADWAKLYCSPQSSHQWKEHRSAYSAAEFFINRNGAESLKTRIADAIGQPVEFEKAIPEYEVRFDRFGRGRIHDLAIFGKAESGQDLFVGVEAKVDEPFGEPVREEYLRAKSKQIAGEKTNAPERIEDLLKLHFTRFDATMFDIRYQLLYATAGTIAAGADISVLYVVVFKTPLFSETASAENFRDYVDFMNKVGADSLKLSGKEAQGHKLSIQGRELICLYEYFEL